MSTPFFQHVHLQFGLHQKIILTLGGLTTAIVLLLDLVTYGTIRRISTNFHLWARDHKVNVLRAQFTDATTMIVYNPEMGVMFAGASPARDKQYVIG
jgi:hypothetical protein